MELITKPEYIEAFDDLIDHPQGGLKEITLTKDLFIYMRFNNGSFGCIGYIKVT